MLRRCAALRRSALLLTTLLAACASGASAAAPDQPAAILDQARLALDADQTATAAALLDRLDPDDLPLPLQERHTVLLAHVEHRQGDLWDAFKLIRNFADDFRFSRYAAEVEELHYRIGAELVRSDGNWWFFQSDRDDGAVVLRQFVERYPSSRRAADALRDLGELAMAEREWQIAQRRFREIVEFHPTSEWVALARFRIAMTAFLDLTGPEYDIAGMRRARNELAAFLDPAPENPDFRDQAITSLATVEDWIARRHDIDARFYRTLKQPDGELFHLRTLVEDYPDHELAEPARRRIAELSAAEAPGS